MKAKAGLIVKDDVLLKAISTCNSKICTAKVKTRSEKRSRARFVSRMHNTVEKSWALLNNINFLEWKNRWNERMNGLSLRELNMNSCRKQNRDAFEERKFGLSWMFLVENDYRLSEENEEWNSGRKAISRSPRRAWRSWPSSQGPDSHWKELEWNF